jgi:predicted enzyme related to lactoylglutathione lyase
MSSEMGLILSGLSAGSMIGVLTTCQAYEPDWLVASVPDAVAALVAAGGTVITEPVEIPVGLIAVVADPFGNALVLVDLSKGRYGNSQTEAQA